MGRTFAVIGDPIDHSLSPNIHSAAFRETGLDSSYIAYRIPRDELEEGVWGLKRVGIDGFNVTIPHKIEMLKYLDRVDESCSMTGAVNTVSNDGGTLKGYNTDMDGFLEPLRRRGIDVRGSRVLLAGAGGAARAVVAGLAREGAGRITITNRTVARAQELAEFARGAGLEASATGASDGLAGDHEIIVNATSAGLGGGRGPISLEGMAEGTVVYDIVYMPMKTDLLKDAKERGAAIIYGYEMLLCQAARAFEIWHGVKAPYDAMKRALLGGF